MPSYLKVMGSLTDFNSKIDLYRKEVNLLLEEAVEKNRPTTLYEPMRYILKAGGKRLRPVLLLLACDAVGGNYQEALYAATAVELLHNFTLIHDDVMDNDDTRRGQPTVHRKWDKNVAILAGDGLVALSYEYLLKTNHIKIDHVGSRFSTTLREVCEGQAYDKEFEVESDVNADDYLRMIKKKTAALLSLCGELGGIIAGATETTVDRLKSFGHNLGMAFQIQDDLFDVLSDEKRLGKTWGSDIRQKKKTLLLIVARNFASTGDRGTIDEILSKPAIESHDINAIKDIFHRSGTIARSEEMLEEHFSRARDELQGIENVIGQKSLEEFLDTIIMRTY